MAAPIGASVHANTAKDVIRSLDACLHCLEDAHERDESRLSAAVATRFGKLVHGLVPGMLISDALDLVFAVQDAYMRSAAPGVSPVRRGRIEGEKSESSIRRGPIRPTPSATGAFPASDEHDQNANSARDLTEDEARNLTARIRAGAATISILLLEAHERRAWSVLGFDTWAEYVRGELGMSRSRSYELLDHARVMRAIQSAAKMSGIPDISPYSAAQLKHRLPEVTQGISSKSSGVSDDDKQQLISEIVDKALYHVQFERAHLKSVRKPVGDSGTAETEYGLDHPKTASAILDLTQLYVAVDYLATLPSACSVLDLISENEGDRLANLSRAVDWLSAFAAERAIRNRNRGKRDTDLIHPSNPS
jgi:hypothetical protein